MRGCVDNHLGVRECCAGVVVEHVEPCGAREQARLQAPRLACALDRLP
jgi:hypothetical protein